jgi:hypothetical protein
MEGAFRSRNSDFDSAFALVDAPRFVAHGLRRVCLRYLVNIDRNPNFDVNAVSIGVINARCRLR